MVPKLHARGTSFKGASAYLFHDKKAKSANRVAWTEALNCWSERPDDAWFEMWDTWKERHGLKREAGIAPGGRDNRNPVLHFSLSWHPDERPNEARMKQAAREALKILGLEDHQAVLVAHNDEPQPHVHVLVNTVHRFTGQTAKLTYSKEALSRWAEAFERADGLIRCDERVKNNERRRVLKRERQVEKSRQDFERAAGFVPAPKKPFEPVKHRPPQRRQWFERQEIIDRMKAMCADQKFAHDIERDGLWQKHSAARSALETSTRQKVDAVAARMAESFRPQWRVIYRDHKAELRHLERNATHPFERAAFVFRNRDRLSRPGKSLGLAGMARLILSGRWLRRAVESAQERERRAVAVQEKTQRKSLMDLVWASHREQFANLSAQQKGEREAMKSHHAAERENVTFAQAKAELMEREDAAPVPVSQHAPEPSPLRTLFERASPDSPALPAKPEKRSERIARQTRESQRKSRGRDDFEREM